MNRHRRNLFLSLMCALAAGTVMSCISDQGGEVGDLPDQKSFVDGKVSQFMEARCAGLDCHGAIGRPLRLYSVNGLRLVPKSDGSRNADAITADERTANYKAVIGLEPEELSRCYVGGKDLEDNPGCPDEDYATLQLLKKPLSIENGGIRHKGGPIMRRTLQDPGWQCLYQWASGASFPDLCEKASAVQ